MTLFAEFSVPSEAFALYETLDEVPETVIEIERVVAHGDVLTPFFWVSGGTIESFEAAATKDPSIQDLRRLDSFEDAVLYRAEWTESTEAIVYAYTNVGATILEATGQAGRWELRIRFTDREQLAAFTDYCDEHDIGFSLQQLYEAGHSRSGLRYGLTPKQHEALETAWKMGYFESPRRATLEDVAAEIGISRQSLSQRLRRAHNAWIENALMVASSVGDAGGE
jgi:predicted DNA binding protein